MNVVHSVVNNIRPIAEKTLRINNWYAELFETKKELWLTDPEGKVYIVRESTYSINHMPKHVKRKLEKYGFLVFWRTAQVRDAVGRIQKALDVYRKFAEHKQPLPSYPFFSVC